MSTPQPRIPRQCPPGFLGRYTIVPGDTMYRLSQMFRVRLEALAANNPHIPDANVLYPGDVLCVPGLIRFPQCVPLQPRAALPFGAGGIAFVNFAPQGGQSVSFMGTLPEPNVFGDFDIFIGEIYLPSIGGFGNQLFPGPESPPSWAGRVDLPTAAQVLPNSRAVIRPANSVSGISGPIILEGVVT